MENPARDSWVGEEKEAEAAYPKNSERIKLIATQAHRASTPNVYSTQFAMKIFVSCSTVPLRLEAHTSRLPSDVNIGKASNPG